jgi:CRP/FNR family nitrogen fixation transcriptional regulator
MEVPMSLAYDLNDVPNTATAPAAALTRVLDVLGARSTYARNVEIYAQEDDVERLFRVISGVVRTTRVTIDGRRQVGDFYYPGDLFGLEIGPLHEFSAEALTECQVESVRHAAVRNFVGDVELDRAILDATRRELQRVQGHVMLLGKKGAREKVAASLLGLAEHEQIGGVDLPMGRQDMADYLGLTIETVSRMLTQLQSDNVVQFPSLRRFKVTQRQALEAIAE